MKNILKNPIIEVLRSINISKILTQSNFIKRSVSRSPFQIFLHFIYMLVMNKRQSAFVRQSANAYCKDTYYKMSTDTTLSGKQILDIYKKSVGTKEQGYKDLRVYFGFGAEENRIYEALIGKFGEEVFNLINTVFSESALNNMVEDETNAKPNPINEANFGKKEFKELWNKINQRAVYTVKFDSTQLITNAKNAIDKELHVTAIGYTVVGGTLNSMDSDKLKHGHNFEIDETKNIKEERSIYSNVKYDLVGKIAASTGLTRKTIGEILSQISSDKFKLFKVNPEEFIMEASRIINEQKAAMVVQKLAYTPIDDRFDTDIFTMNQPKYNFENAKEVKKHIYNYLITDSKNEKNFAEELDASDEVVVYAKLPEDFFIPTPVGDYNPDWAVAFKEGSVQYIYFVAETKGSMSSLQIRKIEEIKIECAERFFNKLSTDNLKLKYSKIDNFDTLWKIVNGR